MQMQDPNQLSQQPTHFSPDGKWFWDGVQWKPTYAADIPAQSQHHQSAAPGGRATGGVGAGLLAALAAAWAYGKYALLFLLKFKGFATLLSLLVSFGGYAVFWGPWFAGALVVMILIHEMGHVLEIRRQGMQATAPIFIPFFGAAIFQRQHATDALHQAQIGIAGPVAGTLASIAALVLFSVTGWWANPFIWLIVIIGAQSIYQRFRNDRLPYYQSVPLNGRLLMGFSWLVLVAILIYGLEQTISIIRPLT